MSTVEQRINLKFLAKLGKTPLECFALLQQVYKEETMSRARAFEWHKRFREGREECEEGRKKARKSKSKVKVMLIVFFDIQGIVHFEFLPQGQTVNQTVYKEILWRLVRSVHDMRRSLWEANAWALHHDNAPAHTALSICQFLAERNIATLEHPPYSPDLAPCDFFLFPKIKSVLKGTHFSDIDSIKKAVTTELKKIPENAFQECFESWKKRMHKCLRVEGNYFEGL